MRLSSSKAEGKMHEFGTGADEIRERMLGPLKGVLYHNPKRGDAMAMVDEHRRSNVHLEGFVEARRKDDKELKESIAHGGVAVQPREMVDEARPQPYSGERMASKVSVRKFKRLTCFLCDGQHLPRACAEYPDWLATLKAYDEAYNKEEELDSAAAAESVAEHEAEKPGGVAFVKVTEDAEPSEEHVKPEGEACGEVLLTEAGELKESVATGGVAVQPMEMVEIARPQSYFGKQGVHEVRRLAHVKKSRSGLHKGEVHVDEDVSGTSGGVCHDVKLVNSEACGSVRENPTTRDQRIRLADIRLDAEDSYLIKVHSIT